jgi:hypothetical protein
MRPIRPLRLRLRWKGLVLFGGVTLALVTACSLIVDTNADQCTSNAECAGFNAVCQAGVCVAGSATEGGPASDAPAGDSPSAGDTGCTPKPKATQEDFLNEPCTNSLCTPFDDCTRLGMCDGGTLPTLVDPPPGGA